VIDDLKAIVAARKWKTETGDALDQSTPEERDCCDASSRRYIPFYCGDAHVRFQTQLQLSCANRPVKHPFTLSKLFTLSSHLFTSSERSPLFITK
jgi:hypothetical protein